MNPAERLRRAPFVLTGRAAEAAWNETLEQGVLEHAVAEAARLGTVDRLVDQLVAAGLLDRLVDAIVEKGLIEHLVSEAVERGVVDRVVDELLESGAIARVASSPDVRAGLAQTSAGLADDLLGSLRASTARADDSAGRFATRLFRRDPAEAQIRPGTAGLVSRLVALFIDAMVVVAAGITLTGAVAIVVNLFGRVDLATVIGVVTAAATSTVAIVAYFALSFTLVGQTVGMRALAQRVTARRSTTVAHPGAAARACDRGFGGAPVHWIPPDPVGAAETGAPGSSDADARHGYAGRRLAEHRRNRLSRWFGILFRARFEDRSDPI